MKEIRYITHLVPDKIPQNGMKKLSFYTAKAEGYNRGEYFWGTDNNSFDGDFIRNLEKKDEIICLPFPKKLDINMGLWINSEGQVYYADLKKPFSNPEFLFAPKQLSRVNQIYDEFIGANNLPEIIHYYELPLA